MTTMPTFAFNLSIDDKAVQEAEAARRSGDWLQPGRQTLEILKVEYKGTVKNDATWLRFSLTLGRPGTKPGDDGKYKGCMFHNVMVPTQDIVYQGKLNVFGMLQSFFAGLGVSLAASNTPEIIQRYFSDFNCLVGMSLEVELGYKGFHVARVGDGFQVMDRYGKPAPLSVENRFTNREAAIGQAVTDNFTIERYMEVLRVLPGPLQEPKSTTKPKTKKPVVNFDE